MALPAVLAVAAGAQVVSGIMQYYQAEKAAGATRARLKEIEKMFDSIVPPDLDLNVFDDPRLAADIPAAKLNTEALTPELYESVGQYVPEVAAFVEQVAPELVQASSAAQEGRQAQLEAMERYRQIASGEFDPELQQRLAEASRRANIDAQSRTASILQDANRRGQLGSGISLAMQQNAAMNAMDRAAQESQMAAAEAYRNQLTAMDKSATLGGNIRSSEMSEAAKNVDILNSFNERASRNYQDYLNARAEANNRAAVMNLDRNQRISDANVALRNKSQEDARDLYNQQQMLNTEAAWKNRNNSLELEERKRLAKQALYNNLMQKAARKSGHGYTNIAYEDSLAQDRNARIAGLADAASSAAQYYGKYADEQKKKNEQVMPDYGGDSMNYSGSRPKPYEDDVYGSFK